MATEPSSNCIWAITHVPADVELMPKPQFTPVLEFVIVFVCLVGVDVSVMGIGFKVDPPPVRTPKVIVPVPDSVTDKVTTSPVLIEVGDIVLNAA